MARVSKYLTLTQANIDHGYIYLGKCIEIFLSDTLGGANKSEAAPRTVQVQFGADLVETDIDQTKRVFRKRGLIRRYFKKYRLAAGHRVLLEQLGPYSFQVSKEPCLALKCLSIQQPWADLILDRTKRVENRNLPWRDAQVRLQNGQRVWLAVHVSKRLSVWKKMRDDKRQELAPGWTPAKASAPGAIVGVVQVIQICAWKDLTPDLQNHKFTDRKNYCWHWILDNPLRLEPPFKWKGNIFFNVDVPCRLLPAELRDETCEK